MTRFFSFSALIILFLIFQSCGDNSPTGIDYSEAPAPFDTTNAVSSNHFDNGLKIYIIEEGDGNFEVTKNDQIQVRFTGRTTDGEIFDSSYRNGSNQPVTFNNLTAGSTSGGRGSSSPLIDGFRIGLMGMIEGERRTIVVPPELGYSDSQEGTSGFDLRAETLIFDVELVEIINP